MTKEIDIKLNIVFPEYEEMKTDIKECKYIWDKNEFEYDSDVTYSHILAVFPGGYFRIYASEDTHFKPAFDDMRGGYVVSWKIFDLSKQGYKELIKYATNEIRNGYKAW